MKRRSGGRPSARSLRRRASQRVSAIIGRSSEGLKSLGLSDCINSLWPGEVRHGKERLGMARNGLAWDSGQVPAGYNLGGHGNGVITEEIRRIEEYINKTWPYLTTRKELPLRELFPEPENKGLKHIWKYGSADLVIYKGGRPVCIIEAGGGQTFPAKQS